VCEQCRTDHGPRTTGIGYRVRYRASDHVWVSGRLIPSRALMQVYNTLGRSMQPFETRDPGQVGMYVCGPTVQAAPHVGHGRQAVAFDVIRRYLEWRGYSVKYVANITDIEDKIIAASIEQGISTAEVAERAGQQFLDAYARLRVRPYDVTAVATEHIPEMIEMIEPVGLILESTSEIRSTLRCGRVPSRMNPHGIRRGVPAGQAGTSSVRRWL